MPAITGAAHGLVGLAGGIRRSALEAEVSPRRDVAVEKVVLNGERLDRGGEGDGRGPRGRARWGWRRRERGRCGRGVSTSCAHSVALVGVAVVELATGRPVRLGERVRRGLKRRTLRVVSRTNLSEGSS